MSSWDHTEQFSGIGNTFGEGSLEVRNNESFDFDAHEVVQIEGTESDITIRSVGEVTTDNETSILILAEAMDAVGALGGYAKAYSPIDSNPLAFVKIDTNDPPVIGDTIGAKSGERVLFKGQTGFKCVGRRGDYAYVRPFRSTGIYDDSWANASATFPTTVLNSNGIYITAWTSNGKNMYIAASLGSDPTIILPNAT